MQGLFLEFGEVLEFLAVQLLQVGQGFEDVGGGLDQRLGGALPEG